MKLKLHELKDSEITAQIDEASKELRNYRFQYAIARSLENPLIIRNLKKKVARLYTIKRERVLGIPEKRKQLKLARKGK